MSKRITVTVRPDGSIVAESSGHDGPACIEDLAVITTMCDSAVILDSKLTTEYFASTDVVDTNLHHQENQQNASER